MNRLVAVVRLHLIVPTYALVMPWGIMALAWGASVALLSSINSDQDVVIVGGLFSLYITLFLSSLQAVKKTLTLAVSLGVTRRAYLAGTCLFYALQAMLAGVVLGLLRLLEQRTGGWGTELRFFDVPFLVGGGPVPAALGFAGSLALTCAVGLGCGAVARRWGTVGTSTLSAMAVVLPSALALWLGQGDRFEALRRWVTGQPELALQALWPTVIAVAVTALAWTSLRRTPA
jgi:hypothetical protein